MSCCDSFMRLWKRPRNEVRNGPPHELPNVSAAIIDHKPYGLKLLSNGTEPTVDIVAIHGLNGHREKTWTARKTNINWLQDPAMLPQLIPNARIMSWGYDANTHDSTKPLSNMTLSDHAAKLVSDLRLYRQEDNTMRRPIIFVAHSLGGIVLKDALNYSDNARIGHLYALKSVKVSTHGIIFLGTPHRGVDGTDIAAMFIRVASIFTSTNARLLEILRRDSEILERQQTQYNAISNRFHTIFAFEAFETPLPGGRRLRIVPRESAVVPGHVDAEAITIMSDHIDIVKFASPSDPGFTTVAGHLRIMARDAPTRIAENWRTEDRMCRAEKAPDFRPEKLGDFVAWLCEVDPSTNYNTAMNMHKKNTSSWLVDTSKYKYWKRSPKSFLWLHGTAGSGKTFLTSFAISHLQNECSRGSRNMALAKYFFSFSDPKKQTVAGMLSSVLGQLCSSLFSPTDDVPECLIDFLLCKDKGERPTNNDLANKLVDIARHFLNVYIAIDALDECPELDEERENLLEKLVDLVDRMPDSAHILCTSRKEVNIEKSMRRLLSQSSGQEIDLARYRKKMMKDIRMYIDSTLESDSFDTWPSDVKKTARDDVMDKCDGMFQYVSCQFANLKKLKDRDSILDALRLLPKDLDETYDRMLDNIHPKYKDKVLGVLKWLVWADQKVSLGVISVAFTIQTTPNTVPKRGGLLFTPEDVLEYLNSLVITYPRNHYNRFGSPRVTQITYVRLAHFSIREYLTSCRIMERPSRLFSITANEAYLHIASSCLVYVLDDDENKDFAFDFYAKGHWAEYVEKLLCRQCSTENLNQRAARALASGSRALRDTIDGTWVYQYGSAHRRSMHGSSMHMMRMPLCFPARFGLKQLMDMLICKGYGEFKYLTQCDMDGALAEAAHAGHIDIIKVLLTRGAQVNPEPGSHRGSPLLAAVKEKRMQIVEQILDLGADINAQNGDMGSPLQVAASLNDVAMIRLLLDRGAEVNLTTLNEDGCALVSAVQRDGMIHNSDGRVAGLTVLLQNGANINMIGDSTGCTALYKASLNPHITSECFHLLLESGADANIVTGKYGNALQAACLGLPGTMAEVELLLGKDADLHASSGIFGSALQAACFYRNSRGDRRSTSERVEGVKFLLKQGADVNVRGGRFGTVLQAACYGYDFRWDCTTLAEILLDHGADVNARGGEFETALIAACSSADGDGSVASLLLSRDADVNIQGGEYGNALQAACYHHRTEDETAIYLMEQGANINAQGGLFGNALQAACYRHRKGDMTVNRLLERDADVNAQGGKFGNALQAAAAGESETLEIMKLLLIKDARVNMEGGYYGTALQAACHSGMKEKISLLLDNGADACIQGGFFGSAWHAMAAVSPHVEKDTKAILELLLEKGADVNDCRGCQHATALEAALYAGAAFGEEIPALLALLLQHGAQWDITFGANGSLLESTCAEEDTLQANLLLQLVPNIPVNTHGGKFGSALQAASLRGHDALVRSLLGKGANVNMQGGECGSALNAAVFKGHWDIVEILLDNGVQLDGHRTPSDKSWLGRIKDEYGSEAVQRYEKFWKVHEDAA